MEYHQYPTQNYMYPAGEPYSAAPHHLVQQAPATGFPVAATNYQYPAQNYMQPAGQPNFAPPNHLVQYAPATGFPVASTNYQYPSPNYTQPAGQVPWSTGLCDCFSDVPNCCITFWFPCITFGQIANIVDRGSVPCEVCAAVYAVIRIFTGCPCFFSCFYRSRMRKEFMLEQRGCNDFCIHFLCEDCALCQEYRELRNRGFHMYHGWHGNMAGQQNQGGPMPMPPAPVMESGMKR
ncbi:hypothetical protein HRI_004115300 [Hibiscus trionum]|uniref:Uncharacterized protein n=2 Tax=Hibiscus trionum TaxID=183268 RepID=A0A9W7IXI0_HIBTR|nr:hypothetical protein HRI_004115300 [Hibiscus trionum]